MIVGASMIGMWAFIIIFDTIPEFETDPIEIIMHLVAEFTTGIVLLLSGIATLKRKIWGSTLYFTGTGMLFYTVIVSPGYYADRSEWGFVAMFAIIFSISLIFLLLKLKDQIKAGRNRDRQI